LGIGENMTQDEIIEMAKQAWISDKEAELITEFDEAYLSCTYLTDLTAFAKLVAQHEREACANIVMNKIDNTSPTRLNTPKDWWNKACQNILGAIQARGRK
jgi:hypothetical protein